MTILQAGAIAARVQHGEAEFLLVTAKARVEQWIFPKGHVEPGETHEAAALRELHEEAGVVATLVGPVGSSRFTLKGRSIEVAYFLAMASGASGASPEGRKMQWLPYAEARSTLTFDDTRQLLDEASRLLEK